MTRKAIAKLLTSFFLWNGWPTEGAKLYFQPMLRFSPSQAFDTLRTAFEPAQDLVLSFVEWSWAAVIHITAWWHLPKHPLYPVLGENKKPRKIKGTCSNIFICQFLDLFILLSACERKLQIDYTERFAHWRQRVHVMICMLKVNNENTKLV